MQVKWQAGRKAEEAGADTVFSNLHNMHQPTKTNKNTNTNTNIKTNTEKGVGDSYSKAGKSEESEVAGRGGSL